MSVCVRASVRANVCVCVCLCVCVCACVSACECIAVLRKSAIGSLLAPVPVFCQPDRCHGNARAPRAARNQRKGFHPVHLRID